MFTYSICVWLIVFMSILFMQAFTPLLLNYILRFVVMFFNVTYPFVSIFGLVWAALPPYIIWTAQFPFRLDAIITIIGSLVLRFVEILAVSKLQAATPAARLDEHAIAMTQKMDKVTLPIKLRAIWAGFQTGYADRYLAHDNSWWVSFGSSGALLWVQRWLTLLLVVMSASVIGGVVQFIIVGATDGWNGLQLVLMPLIFGMLSAGVYLWLIYEPFLFVVKGKASWNVAPRWAEMVVLLIMLIGVLSYLNNTDLS